MHDRNLGGVLIVVPLLLLVHGIDRLSRPVTQLHESDRVTRPTYRGQPNMMLAGGQSIRRQLDQSAKDFSEQIARNRMVRSAAADRASRERNIRLLAGAILLGALTIAAAVYFGLRARVPRPPGASDPP